MAEEGTRGQAYAISAGNKIDRPLCDFSGSIRREAEAEV